MRTIIISALLAATTALNAQTLPPPIPLPPLVPSNVETFGNGVPLQEFLKIVLGGAAKKDYVLVPDGGATPLINVNVKAFKKDPVPLVRELLASVGYDMREVQGTLIVEKKKEKEEKKQTTIGVYKPVHRTAGSLMGYLSMISGLESTTTASVMRSPVAGATNAQAAVNESGTQMRQPDTDPPYVVFKGTEQAVKEASALLAQLDTQTPEVMLRAFVFEVRDTNKKESSVQVVLSLLGGHLTLNAGAAPTGDVMRLTVPNLSAAVSSLASNSRVKLVSSPVLRAADGSTATAQIGTDTPTLGAIVSQNGAATQSIQYQQAGVLLSLTPRVLEKSIRLAISQEISSFVQTTTGISTSPTKLRRSFKSDVVASDGEVLLLGGLSEQSTSEAKQKSFFFNSGKAEEESSSEFVVMLQVQRL